MEPIDLIDRLTTSMGSCLRFCAYCPDEYETAEVKECVESMLKEIYKLRAENTRLKAELDDLKKGNHDEYFKD